MQNPNRRLPPLDLLLTFEAAARHLSFTRAAEERFVTQSAVSRQIRALEESLGVPLFRRAHRRIQLTEAGEELATACNRLLGGLRETVERLRNPQGRRALIVTTMPGLASLWLIPRLSRFMQLQPDVDVRLDVTYERRDLVADDIDVAIRYGRSDGHDGIKLFEEEVIPVCSPALLRRTGLPLAQPSDLAHFTLLRVDNAAGAGVLQDWAPWLTALRIPELDARALLSFSNYDEVIAAAIHGQGIALGRRPLVDSLLENGTLIAPFAGSFASARAYFILVSPASARRPETRALVDWLIDEARPRPAGEPSPTSAGEFPAPRADTVPR